MKNKIMTFLKSAECGFLIGVILGFCGFLLLIKYENVFGLLPLLLGITIVIISSGKAVSWS